MAVNYRDNTPFEGDNHTVGELAKAIRTKMYGVDVREPIAQAVEKMENWTKGANIGTVTNTPTKVFEDLEDLQNSYPNGADGVFVTTDNGHKYYWQNNQWNDGGAYQAAGVVTDRTLRVKDKAPDSQVTGDRIRDLENAKNMSVFVIQPSEYEFSQYELQTGSPLTSIPNKQIMARDMVNLGNRSKNLGYFVASGYLLHIFWYNADGTFKSSTTSLSGHGKLVAETRNFKPLITRSNYQDLDLNARWQVELFQYDESGGQPCFVIDSNDESNMANVDTYNGKIKFSSGYSKLFIGAQEVVITGQEIDYSSMFNTPQNSWGHIYYDASSMEFVIRGVGNPDHYTTSHLSYFGTVWNNGKTVDLNIYPAYKVDGVITSHGDVFRKTESKARKMAVLGDSISTFKGISEDTGDGANHPIEFYPTGNVTSENDMWWSIVNRGLGFDQPMSVSAYSRSSYAKQTDEIPAGFYDERINRLGSNNYEPSHIFVELGVNDNYQPTGENHHTNDIGTLENYNTTTYAGVAETLAKIRNKYHNAKIFVLLPKSVALDNITQFDFAKFAQTKKAIREVAEDFGVEKIIDLSACGINPKNATAYATSGDGVHPNKAGHQMMADYIISEVRDFF